MKGALLGLAFACTVASQGCGSGRPRAPMSDGERTYRAKCAACHRLHEPGERTPEQWESAVAKMQRLKKVRLSQADEDLILGYLAGAQGPGRSRDAPDPEKGTGPPSGAAGHRP